MLKNAPYSTLERNALFEDVGGENFYSILNKKIKDMSPEKHSL
jgi:hypothetical protein